MSIATPLAVTSLLLTVVAGALLIAPRIPERPRTLLVAVDLASGQVRALAPRKTEAECLQSTTSYFDHQWFEVKPTERLDCRAPK